LADWRLAATPPPRAAGPGYQFFGRNYQDHCGGRGHVKGIAKGQSGPLNPRRNAMFNGKVFVLAASMAAMLVTGAQAQYTTTPNIYGHPEFGTTTTGPYGGQYRTMPNIYGHPEFGTTSTGPNGASCSTTANVYGHPELGVRTTCH
jgi:hypothetical protein